MHPHIEVKNKSINANLNYNEPGFDETVPALYHVFISQDKLKVLFTVEWTNPEPSIREFQVVKHDHLYLDGTDSGQAYPIGDVPYSGTISADPTIVQELFKKNLDPYGIVLNKVTVHDLTFFESIDFTFTDSVVLEKLYDMINEECIRVKYSPGHLF